MCPGGVIAPCATSQEEIVTNGWSPSKRNNPFANSGIVVNVTEEDTQPYKKYGALAGLYFREAIERKAWEAGGSVIIENEKAQMSEIIFMDAIGQIVFTANVNGLQYRLNHTDWKPGMYFVTVLFSEGGQLTKKLIIK
jgi:hypothetical protein